ncbi:MAG: hypothetical protein KME26_08230 [Oscillatoria princeps RMCB-10]|jgi:hypothetical protein|nr:hypothetical protein [Oscillatoria princeps RMCB-10]
MKTCRISAFPLNRLWVLLLLFRKPVAWGMVFAVAGTSGARAQIVSEATLPNHSRD